LRVGHSIVALWPGTDSQVFLWSSARIAGVPIGALVEQRGETTGCASDTFVTPISRLSKANDASQFGIGVVAARIAQLVLRDERAVVPIGGYNKDFGVTLSLPGVVGRAGVIRSFEPDVGRRAAGIGSPPISRNRRVGGVLPPLIALTTPV
jgi:malate/lactate dehydrogenase